jgi:hypothetical protein
VGRVAEAYKLADRSPEAFRMPIGNGYTMPEGFRILVGNGYTMPEAFRVPVGNGYTVPEAFRAPVGNGYTMLEGFRVPVGNGYKKISYTCLPVCRYPHFNLFPDWPVSHMTNPTPFFDNDYFETRDVILRRLKKFSLAAILRLEQDNPKGVFDTLLVDLKVHHDALFGTMLSADQGTNKRRGYAVQMWSALEGLQNQLETDEALIDYKSKKNPLIRAEFLPKGRTEYTNATLETADLLFQRVVNAATAHAATLGAEFDASRYTALYEQFKAGRQGTGEGDEQSAKARAEGISVRDQLTQRLTDAVKLVAAQFLRDEARCAAYFPFHLLQPGEHDAEDDVKPTV